MRTLTIHRKKSAVGCLAAMKVYIEDTKVCDLKINGLSCRKLGELGNGQQVSFEISHHPARIFVVADKLSKNFCNDFYPVPGGTEDISVTGKNRYNPLAGNPFWFDNVTDLTALENRKKTKRKSLLVMLTALLLGFVIGLCAVFGVFSRPEPKNFRSEGMTITLTDEFQEVEDGYFDVCFDSKDVAIFCLREPFTLREDFPEMSLQEYGELMLENNNFESSVKIQTSDGQTWFTYTTDVAGNTYHYFAYLYKAEDAFWMLQFSVLEENLDEYRDEIVEWSKSVAFQ